MAYLSVNLRRDAPVVELADGLVNVWLGDETGLGMQIGEARDVANRILAVLDADLPDRLPDIAPPASLEAQAETAQERG